MKIRYFILGCLLLCWLPSAKAQIADSIRMHIDSCLTILKENSLYANQVNWPDIRQKVLQQSKEVTTKAGTFEALKIAFDALGDKHAAYYHYENEYRLNNDTLVNRYTQGLRKAWAKGPAVNTAMLDRVAYVSVPYMGVNKQEQIDWYANWLQDSLYALYQQHPEGWIIDLRLNGGGNIRPMLSGLAMFFDDGVVSYYVDRDGLAADEAAFRKGDFLIDGLPVAKVKNKVTGCCKAKVAVLIGPGTGSSGELTAAVFSQRPHTMLFGSPTAGMANAANGFVFNGDNTYFLISVARMANRYKVLFPEVIQPAVHIDSNDAFDDLKNDTVVQVALKWLRTP